MFTIAGLLLLAGLSEAAGRLLPVVSRRPGASRRFIAISLVAGALVEAAVFTSWPWVAGILAGRLADGGGGSVEWTSRLVAPLLLAAILAFPLIGPFLHAALVTGVGISLARVLHTNTGTEWWTSLTCVAAAGIGLTLAVASVRLTVAWAITPRARPAVT